MIYGEKGGSGEEQGGGRTEMRERERGSGEEQGEEEFK